MGLFLGKAMILGLMGAVLGYGVGFAVTAAFNGGALDQFQLFNSWLLLCVLLLAPSSPPWRVGSPPSPPPATTRP